MADFPTLGIIAGGGDAPKKLIAACHRLNRPFFVLALEGQADADVVADVAGVATPHHWLPLGAASTALTLARQHGVQEIVMLGHVRRPSFSEIKPDFLMLQKLMKIGLNLLGDDGLLKAIAAEMEAEGFTVIAPQDVFADLIMPEGQLGRIAADATAQHDITRALTIAAALGGLDIGQAVVVQQGIVLAVEAAEGTAALLQRAGTLRRAGLGGVLVKSKKPQQDSRFDLPSLGLATVEQAAAAGLRGIVTEAGASLLIDKEAVRAAADAAGLFIIGHKPVLSSPLP